MEFTPTPNNKTIIKYIISQLNSTSELSLEDKINFTADIINNIQMISNIKEFYEEDCHIVLLDWVWSSRVLLTEDNITSQLIRDLLFNTIIIFELFPFNLKDIIDNCFIFKLKTMRQSIKAINIALACRLKNLTSYWSKMIAVNKKNMMLQRKRTLHMKFINESESEISSVDTDISRNSSFSKNSNKKKKVTWKSDMVNIVEFCSEKRTIVNENTNKTNDM